MPLITCPDCGKQVSDRAETCIGCGAPLGASSFATPSSNGPPVEIEATNRSLKNQMILGFAMVFAGVLVWLYGGGVGIAGVLMFLGAIVYISARFSAWYRNG